MVTKRTGFGWRCLRRWITGVVAAGLLVSMAQAQTLVIESWRTEDKALWERHILPAFHRQHPGITVKFAPTARALYDQALAARLDAGIAGDLISCRPFDGSLSLFQQGHLLPLDGLPALEHFPARHRIAWQTDDGQTTFCLPMASVMHGVFYNRAIFRRLGLEVPRTEAEWIHALRRVREEAPGLEPLALGTADRWESHQLLFTSIGPNHWKGESGRLAVLQGTAALTDPMFIGVWQRMRDLSEWMPAGYQAQGYEAMLDLFGRGMAAMRPGGSWEIQQLRAYPRLQLGVFPPPVPQPGDACHVTDHMDIGMGINPRSQHPEAARQFLQWLGSAEFTRLFAKVAVGFYPLSDHPFTLNDPLAQEMHRWRSLCQTTIRLNAHRLNRVDPDMEEHFWTVNAMVLNRQLAPEQAAQRLQKYLSRLRASAPP